MYHSIWRTGILFIILPPGTTKERCEEVTSPKVAENKKNRAGKAQMERVLAIAEKFGETEVGKKEKEKKARLDKEKKENGKRVRETKRMFEKKNM